MDRYSTSDFLSDAIATGGRTPRPKPKTPDRDAILFKVGRWLSIAIPAVEADVLVLGTGMADISEKNEKTEREKKDRIKKGNGASKDKKRRKEKNQESKKRRDGSSPMGVSKPKSMSKTTKRKAGRGNERIPAIAMGSLDMNS